MNHPAWSESTPGGGQKLTRYAVMRLERLYPPLRLRPPLPRARRGCQGGRPRARRTSRSSSGSADPDLEGEHPRCLVEVAL